MWRCGRHWRRLGSRSGRATGDELARASMNPISEEHPMTATSPTAAEYMASPNRVLSAANGIDYAYRDLGEGTPPLVLLQHFRGNLDNWDPALIDALATDRRVVTFDNAGVGGSTGTTPSTVTQMAIDAIAFLEAM